MSRIHSVTGGKSGVLYDATGLLYILQVGEARGIELKDGDEGVANLVVHEGECHTNILIWPRDEEIVGKLRRADFHEGCPVRAPLWRDDSEGNGARAQDVALLIIGAIEVINHTRDAALQTLWKAAITTARGECGIIGTGILADRDARGV